MDRKGSPFGPYSMVDSPTRLPGPPIGLVALRSTASRSTRIRLFLLPLVLAFLPYGYSENCSLKLSRIRCQKYARGVKHHWGQDRRQLKGAGRTLETPGS